MLRFAALALLVLPLVAQSDPMVKKIIEEGKQRSQVMNHLDHLTNRIGPRLTSSDRLTQAGEWAVEQFRSWGLDARLEQWGTFPVGFNRGPSSGKMIAPFEMSFTFSTPAWSVGTKGVARGEAIMAPSAQKDIEALEGKLAGKWIVHHPRSGGRRRGGGGGGGERMSRAAFDTLKKMATDEGAFGLITTSGQAIVRTSGNWRISWDELPSGPCSITVVDENFKALTKALSEAGSEPVVLQFDIRNWFKKGPIPLYNVVADLKGTEKPDEYVVIGGHLDSWDGATGTTDNGTGSSTTLEAARILAACGAKPKRTIRFMLWSGEEQGLLGSAAWCKANQEMLSKISGCFVHDGGTNYVAGVRGTPTQQEQLKAAMGPCTAVDPENFPFTIGEVRSLRGGGSDHGSYLAHNVPGYFWSQKGRAVYSYGWHTQNDTYDIAIPEYQTHTATVVALAAYGVANLPKLLDRTNMRSTSERTPLERRMGLDFEANTLKVKGFTSERSVARRAGVKKGDVLVDLDGVALKNDRFILRAAANNGEPRKKLTVKRGDEKIVLDIRWRR